MLTITPINAFNDNYIWLLVNEDKHCVVVDPGDAAPVLAALKEQNLKLHAIFITHHHFDHMGGVAELKAATGAKVYGPMNEVPDGLIDQRLQEGDTFTVDSLAIAWQIIDLPGPYLGPYCLLSSGHVILR